MNTAPITFSLRPDPLTLFARYLDLTPLRGRRRGLVPCRFHDDRTGSLSLDLERGIFHCFGCGLGGGMKYFAELVGERVDRPPAQARLQRPSSPLEVARTRVLTEARRQKARLEPYHDFMGVNDFLRIRFHLVTRARRVATALGPSERIWDLLDLAARVETEALAVETEMDVILAEGRIV